MTTTLSPTVHELCIKRHMVDDTDDPVLQGLHDAVKQARVLSSQASDTTAIVLRNSMKSEPARHRDARTANGKLLERATKPIDDAVQVAQAEIAAIRLRVKAPPPAKDIVSETKQRELRERLSALPEDRRKAIITDAIKNDDQMLVSAILSAPAWLCGLSDAELALHRNAWASKHFAADLDRVERLSKAVNDANRAGSVAISFIDGLTRGDLVEKSEALEREANAALAAIK
jgi:hypothetical protein